MKFLAVLIAAFAIPAFFVSGDSLAASQSITPVIGSVQSIDVSSLSFIPNYVVFDLDYSAANSFQKINAAYQVGSNTSGNPFNYNFDDSFCSYTIRITNLLTQLICSFDASKAPVYRINPIFPNQFSVGVTMTFFDVLPGESEPCPDCPEIPELPYGEKLDHLTAAIIFVPATMLVLYFMFAIYSMFFRGLK